MADIPADSILKFMFQHGWFFLLFYFDVITSTMVSQITGISIVHSAVCSGADEKTKPLVTGLCEGYLSAFPFDDVIMFH